MENELKEHLQLINNLKNIKKGFRLFLENKGIDLIDISNTVSGRKLIRIYNLERKRKLKQEKEEIVDYILEMKEILGQTNHELAKGLGVTTTLIGNITTNKYACYIGEDNIYKLQESLNIEK